MDNIDFQPKIKKEVINLVDNEISKIIKEVKNKPKKKIQNKVKDVDSIINDIRKERRLKQKQNKITFSRTEKLPQQSFKIVGGKRRSVRNRKKPKRYGYDEYV